MIVPVKTKIKYYFRYHKTYFLFLHYFLGCIDKYSNCADLKIYCKYLQDNDCPKTCGKCSDPSGMSQNHL